MTSILTIIQQQDQEYDRLHALYQEAEQRVASAPTPEELEAATTAFYPIQQEFLRNRERATPTECYQIIASFLDRESRARLAQCDRHQHYQVIYGKYSGRFVWSVGGLLEQVYRRTYKKNPKTRTTTPLLHASREGSSSVVRVLIEAKANLEAVDDVWSCTALHWACWEGHEEVVGLLIDAGANVNVIVHGWSPLCFAVETNSLPIVRRLLTAGANPIRGFGLLKVAKMNNGEMVNVLLEGKADVNSANDGGWTVLHYAAQKNSMNVVPILIAAGANINHRNKTGETPLLWACIENNTDAAIALLTANADPNIVDNNWGESPLMWASQKRNVDVVRALLAANANVRRVNICGDTALKRAKRKNHDEVIALLLAAGAIDEDNDDGDDDDGNGNDNDDDDDDDDDDDE